MSNPFYKAINDTYLGITELLAFTPATSQVTTIQRPGKLNQ